MDIKTSLKSLSAGDDASTAPSVGDDVDFPVTGKVTAIDGDSATVTLATVNGEPVTDSKPAKGKKPDNQGDTDADMQAMAASADAGGGSMGEG